MSMKKSLLMELTAMSLMGMSYGPQGYMFGGNYRRSNSNLPKSFPQQPEKLSKKQKAILKKKNKTT